MFTPRMCMTRPKCSWHRHESTMCCAQEHASTRDLLAVAEHLNTNTSGPLCGLSVILRAGYGEKKVERSYTLERYCTYFCPFCTWWITTLLRMQQPEFWKRKFYPDGRLLTMPTQDYNASVGPRAFDLLLGLGKRDIPHASRYTSHPPHRCLAICEQRCLLLATFCL